MLLGAATGLMAPIADGFQLQILQSHPIYAVEMRILDRAELSESDTMAVGRPSGHCHPLSHTQPEGGLPYKTPALREGQRKQAEVREVVSII